MTGSHSRQNRHDRLSRRRLLRLAAAGGASGMGGLGVALTACLPRGRGEAPAEKRAAPVALELWGAHSAAQREDQAAAWTRVTPGVTVRFKAASEVGVGAAALRRLAAAVAGKNGPDLLDADRFEIASYVAWRVLRPLTDLARGGGLDVSRFLPAAIEEATGLDGTLYGVPNGVDTRLLLWNKARFAAVGLDPEQPPATWDAMQQAAVRLARDGGGRSDQQGGQLGFHPEEGQSTLHLFAWQHGGGFQTADGRTATLTHPENAAALGWLKQLVEAQAAPPATRALRNEWLKRGDGPTHPFLTGALAMQYQIPNWLGSVLARHRPDLPFGVAFPPVRRAGDAPLSWAGGYAYAIPRQAKAPDAAWAVLTWLTGEEGLRAAHEGERARVAARGGAYVPGLSAQPALDSALLDAYRTGVPALDAAAERALALLPHSRIRERSLAAAELWDAVTAALSRVLAGQQTPEAALAEQNALVQRALDQGWTIVGQGGKGGQEGKTG